VGGQRGRIRPATAGRVRPSSLRRGGAGGGDSTTGGRGRGKAGQAGQGGRRSRPSSAGPTRRRSSGGHSSSTGALGGRSGMGGGVGGDSGQSQSHSHSQPALELKGERKLRPGSAAANAEQRLAEALEGRATLRTSGSRRAVGGQRR
jgi:hypothetical protein